MQIGAISPDNPGIEIGDDRLALRRFPTLPPIARHLRAQVQVLNHDLLVALMARAGRRLRRHDDRRVNRQLVRFAAAATGRLLAFGALGAVTSRNTPVRCLVHAGRLVRRTRRQFLQPRKLVLDRLVLHLQLCQGAAELLVLRLNTLHFANQLTHQSDQFRMRQAIERIRAGYGHPQLESHFQALDSPPRPEICPGYARLHRAQPFIGRSVVVGS